MRSTDPKGRLAVIGGDARWQRRLFRLAEEAGLVPEIMSWEEASGIEAPVSGIVVHVARADEVLDTFRAWARLGFPSVSIVSLESSPGAAEVKAELEAMGFKRILLARPWVRAEGRYWSALADSITAVASPNLALVPIVVNILGRSDIGFVRLVSAALEPPVARSVERWCKRLDVTRYRLAGMVRDLGLPGPKRTLDLLRLTLAVHLRATTGATHDTAAELTGFRSGDYLGRRCRSLLGCSFGDAVERGIAAVLEPLRAA